MILNPRTFSYNPMLAACLLLPCLARDRPSLVADSQFKRLDKLPPAGFDRLPPTVPPHRRPRILAIHP